MTPFDDATRAQVNAATPTNSTWVSANAGSGKTRVLTDRVARLLLGGCAPGKILCLTYTKAAAAEMQNRLFDRLGAWAMMPDTALRDALAQLGETDHHDPQSLRAARRLFANALETPGGLKIQTIHAFCDTILRRFPLEAGVPAQFEALDDLQARRLRADVLDQLAGGPQADLVNAFAAELTSAEIDDLLAEIAEKREALDIEALGATLGPPSLPDWQSLYARITDPEGPQLCADLADAVGDSAKYGADFAALAQIEEAEAFVKEAERLCLNGKSAKVPLSGKTLGAKALRAANPALFARLDAFVDRVSEARVLRADARLMLRSQRLAEFADAFLTLYDRAKLLTGRLDFSDLIRFAAQLLESSDSAQWVLYRLDGGIDHILVDEAQDTSPDQWRVIERLAEEFTAGEGRSDAPRTLFVVGDEKQSIYSFQGANPEIFDKMRTGFANRLQAAQSPLVSAELAHSFRSADPILRLVDAVFAGPAGQKFSLPSHHLPFKDQLPGRVDLWPFLEKEDAPEELPWHVPVDTPDPSDPRKELANKVARWIAAHLQAGTALPGSERALRPGDFLILVQRRGPFFHHVIKALKQQAIPVAGADRMRIGDELAVRDILSLLRWIDLQDDDLSLAEAMRSPILGFSEAELFTLAHGRKGTLWQALRAHPAFGDQVAMLRDLRDRADYLRPFELIDRILTHHGGRSRLLGRLGDESEDAIDELLSQALRYEQTQIPSLSGFLHWFAAEDVVVKREMDSGANDVRVMTVHGAKGLEAPVVILPDTAQQKGAADRTSLLPLSDGGLIWKMPTGEERGLSLHQLEASEARSAFLEAERLRLLYVAMTRAEQWLVVAGAGDRGTKPLSSWYTIIADTLSSESAPITAPINLKDRIAGPVQSLQYLWTETLREPAVSEPDAVSMPDWVKRPAPPPVSPPRPILPSGLPGPKALAGPGALPEEEAMQRGTQLHLLLEHLAGIPSENRADLAARLLTGAMQADPPTQASLLAEASAVLDAEDLSWIFAPDTLAEVPITGILESYGHLRMDGVIDRLVFDGERVIAVDFKSNAVVPDRAEDIPLGILRQLAAYREVLCQIYPQKEVVTGILWTSEARFMSVPHKLVIAALAGVASS